MLICLSPNTLVKICGITTLQQAIKIANLDQMLLALFQFKNHQDISQKKKEMYFRNFRIFISEIERVSVVKNCPIDIIKNSLSKPRRP